jgi:hypothetical protein
MILTPVKGSQIFFYSRRRGESIDALRAGWLVKITHPVVDIQVAVVVRSFHGTDVPDERRSPKHETCSVDVNWTLIRGSKPNFVQHGREATLKNIEATWKQVSWNQLEGKINLIKEIAFSKLHCITLVKYFWLPGLHKGRGIRLVKNLVQIIPKQRNHRCSDFWPSLEHSFKVVISSRATEIDWT